MSDLPSLPIDPDALLRTDAFVRRLARSLVGDAAAAEDVAQQAWLVAIEQPPRAEVPLRGWLTTVVRRLAARLRRTQGRRLARESIAARSEAIPPEAEYRERELLRRTVVDAVFVLDEPYRTTLLLRFLDDLPPRKVAERMDVPVETVRTRVRRGLDLVRVRLDGSQRGAADPRAAWVALIFPLARGRDGLVASTFGSVSIGGTLVALKAKVAVGVAAVVIAAGVVAWQWTTRASRPDEALVAASASDSASGDSDGETSDGDAAATALPQREAEVLAAAPNGPVSPLLDQFGGLDVRVVTEQGLPVKGIGVFLEEPVSKAAVGAGLRAVTGLDGFCAFEKIAVGPVMVLTDSARSARGHVRSGSRSEIVVRLGDPTGWFVDITGVVLHGGEPIEGAEIHVASRMGAMEYPPFEPRPVATSGREGRFTLHAVAVGSLVGATAPGFGPSAWVEARSIVERASLEVRLALADQSGRVTGRVLDEYGEPIADARVLVGNDQRWLFGTEADPGSGSRAHPRLSRLVRSGPSGGFDVDHLLPGQETVCARAEGFAPWIGAVEIRDAEASECEIVMKRGARVEGFVRDADGAALSGAEIRAGPQYRFTSTLTRSREDGSFRLDGLAAGTSRIEVSVREQGRCVVSLELEAGTTTRWDATLDPGGVIRGTIRNNAGEPLARWRVEARGSYDDPLETEHLASGTADSQGAFELKGLVAPRYSVTISDSMGNRVPAASRRDVHPGGELLEIVVPARELASAHLVGSFRGPTGEVVTPIELLVGNQEGGSGIRRQSVDASTGSFDVGPLPPGLYFLRAEARGFPAIEKSVIRLEPNGRTDLGELRFDTGALLVLKFSGDDIDLDGATVNVHARGGFSKSVPIVNAVASIEGLPSGRCFAEIQGPALAAQACSVEIAAGATVEREITVAKGVPLVLRLHPPSKPPAANVIPGASLSIPDSQIQLLSVMVPDLATTPFDWKVRLAPGTYSIQVVWLMTGQPFDQSLVVRADDPVGRIVEVVLP